MSTKIYNGIKFKSRNLTEILSQLQTIRNILLNICGSEEYVPQENLIEFIWLCPKLSIYLHYKLKN